MGILTFGRRPQLTLDSVKRSLAAADGLCGTEFGHGQAGTSQTH
jgi:hypothetical protein